MRFSSRRYVTLVMILGILIATFCLPIGVAHARVQNISITKLIDEPEYKKTLFIITMNGETSHILVAANITIIGAETVVNLTASIINPHPSNTTIIASATIPDTLYDAPYLEEPIEAFHIWLPDWAVTALKIALPIVILIAIIGQMYTIITDIIVDVAEAILDMLLYSDFVWASIPWILLTLLYDNNLDGSWDLFIPFSPVWEHLNLVLEGHYFLATSLSWWEIMKHKICLPWPLNWICWKYYTAEWVCPRAEPPEPKPPHASFEWEPIQPIVDEEIIFTSTSFDPDGAITAHQWWLGDGNETTEESFTHVYLLTGDYNVTLEVTDDDGLTDNVTHTLSVQPEVQARLRVFPDYLDVNIVTGHSETAKFIARESLNQTELQGVTFQASDLKNPDGDVISSGNVTFDKNGITIAKGSYINVTVTFQAPTSLPTGWYNGNITAFSENGDNDTIYVDLRITPPFYELSVASSPITEITYTINGSERMTPHTEMLPEGFYTLGMPQTHKGYVWSHWLEDGDTNRIKTILLQGTTWTAVYEPAPKPVGGKATTINILMNKPETPTLWIWLSTIILSLAVTVVYIKKRKRKPEIFS